MSTMSYMDLAAWICAYCQPTIEGNGVSIDEEGLLNPPGRGMWLTHHGDYADTGRSKDEYNPQSGLQLHFQGYKIAICVDIGKASLTMQSGSLPFQALTDHTMEVLRMTINGLKISDSRNCVLCVLLHDPNNDLTWLIWTGEIDSDTSLAELSSNISHHILKFRSRDQEFCLPRLPSLESFIESAALHMASMPALLKPVVIVLAVASLQINIPNIQKIVSRNQIIVHIAAYNVKSNLLSDVGAYEIAARASGGTFSFIGENPESPQQNSLTSGNLFRMSLFQSRSSLLIPNDTVVTHVLKIYQFEALNHEFLIASRLCEGFSCSTLVWPSVTSATSTFRDGNVPVVLVLEKQMTKFSSIIYEIKYRKNRSHNDLGYKALVCVEIKRRCPVKYIKSYFRDLFSSECESIYLQDQFCIGFTERVYYMTGMANNAPHSRECKDIGIFLNKDYIKEFRDMISELTDIGTSHNVFALLSLSRTSLENVREPNCEELLFKTIQYIPSEISCNYISKNSALIFFHGCSASSDTWSSFILKITSTRKLCFEFKISPIFWSSYKVSQTCVYASCLAFYRSLAQFAVPLIWSRSLQNIFNEDMLQIHDPYIKKYSCPSHMVHRFSRQLPFNDKDFLGAITYEYRIRKLAFGFHLISQQSTETVVQFLFAVHVKRQGIFFTESVLICQLSLENDNLMITYSTENFHLFCRDKSSSLHLDIENLISELIIDDEDLFNLYVQLVPYLKETDIDLHMDVKTYDLIRSKSISKSLYLDAFLKKSLNESLLGMTFDSIRDGLAISILDSDENLDSTPVFKGYKTYKKALILINFGEDIGIVDLPFSNKVKLVVYGSCLPTCSSYISSKLAELRDVFCSASSPATHSIVESRESIFLDSDIESFLERVIAVYQSCFIHAYVSECLESGFDEPENVEAVVSFCCQSSKELDISSLISKIKRKAAEINDVSREFASRFDSIMRKMLLPVPKSPYFVYLSPDDESLIVSLQLVLKHSDDMSPAKSIRISSDVDGFLKAILEFTNEVYQLADFHETVLKIDFNYPKYSLSSGISSGSRCIFNSVDGFLAREACMDMVSLPIGKVETEILHTILKKVPETISFDIVLDFILSNGEKMNTFYDSILLLLSEEFQTHLGVSRFGELFLSKTWRKNVSESHVPCLILLSTSQFLCSLLHRDNVKSHILSVAVKIYLFVPNKSDVFISEVAHDITLQIKIAGYEVNQKNLLVDLYETRNANPYLVSSASMDHLEIAKTEFEDSMEALTKKASLYNGKSTFAPDCFRCKLQDRIDCSLPGIQGFKYQNIISNIAMIFDPFSVRNNDKCFVFKDDSSHIFYILLNLKDNSDSTVLTIYVFGVQSVSKDAVQKLKDAIESKLLEYVSNQISTVSKANATFQLQPSHLNFLRDNSKRHIEAFFTLPPYVQDHMHYCIVVRQMLLLMLTAPVKVEIPVRETWIAATFSHPTCIGYDLRKESSKKSSTPKFDNQFGPKLKRSQSVVPEFFDSLEVTSPVFFGSSYRKGQHVDAPIVEWNQNDFTFLYEERTTNAAEGRAGVSRSETAARSRSETSTVPYDKRQAIAKKLKTRIGQGVALVDFSVLADNFDPSSLRYVMRTCSRDSIDNDMASLDAASDIFTILTDSRKRSLSSSSDSSAKLKSKGKVVKLRIFPTDDINVGSLYDFCISMISASVKIYCIERSISVFLHPVDQSTLSSEPDISNDPLHTFLLRVNKIISIKEATLPKDLYSLCDYISYRIKLPLTLAMSIKNKIIDLFLERFQFFSLMMINTYLDPKVFDDTDHRSWYSLSEDLEGMKNVSIFSDTFKDIASDLPSDLHILQNDTSSPIMQFLGNRFQKVHFLIEIAVSASGIYLLHYNISSNIISTLKNIISDQISQQEMKSTEKASNLLCNLCMFDGATLEVESNSFVWPKAKYSKEFCTKEKVIHALLWSERRISKLYVLPRDTEAKLSSSLLTSMVPLKHWRRGVIMSSVKIPLVSHDVSINKSIFLKYMDNMFFSTVFQEVEFLSYQQDNCGILVQPINLSASMRTFDIRSLPNNYVEITERLVDLLDVLNCDALEENERAALQRSIQHQCLLRSLNRFSFDDAEAVLGPHSFLTNIYHSQSSHLISSQLFVLPLNMLYDDLLNSKQPVLCDVETFSRKLREILSLLQCISQDLVHFQWSTLALSQSSAFLDPTFSSLTSETLTKTIASGDLLNNLFILKSLDDEETQLRLICGCLYEGPTSDSLKHIKFRGISFIQNNFHSLRALHLLFPTAFRSSVHTTRKKSHERVDGITPVYTEFHDAKYALHDMSRQFEALIIKSLNSYTISKLWGLYIRDASSLSEEDLNILISASKAHKLEYLSFLSPVLKSIARKIESFLHSFCSAVKDVSVSKTSSTDGNCFVLIVDRTIIYQFGLLLSFGSASDCFFSLLQNPDYHYEMEVHQNLKKGLIDKVLNHILNVSLLPC